jgi:hypothetical protein
MELDEIHHKSMQDSIGEISQNTTSVLAGAGYETSSRHPGTVHQDDDHGYHRHWPDIRLPDRLNLGGWPRRHRNSDGEIRANPGSTRLHAIHFDRTSHLVR